MVQYVDLSWVFGRTSPMLATINNYVTLLYSEYNNSNVLLLINDSNGSVIYRENLTNMESEDIYYSTVVDSVLINPCYGSSLCGIDLLSGRPKVGFLINNLSGT